MLRTRIDPELRNATLVCLEARSVGSSPMEDPAQGSFEPPRPIEPADDWAARAIAAARRNVPGVPDGLAAMLADLLRGGLQDRQTPSQLKEMIKGLARENQDPT
jgi:hypothetical protein